MQVQEALRSAQLEAGAIGIRFPEKFAAGAFTNPDDDLRMQAVQLAIQGCRTAAEMGARDLIVWSPYDGYNYHFQVIVSSCNPARHLKHHVVNCLRRALCYAMRKAHKVSSQGC